MNADQTQAAETTDDGRSKGLAGAAPHRFCAKPSRPVPVCDARMVDAMQVTIPLRLGAKDAPAGHYVVLIFQGINEVRWPRTYQPRRHD